MRVEPLGAWVGGLRERAAVRVWCVCALPNELVHPLPTHTPPVLTNTSDTGLSTNGTTGNTECGFLDAGYLCELNKRIRVLW